MAQALKEDDRPQPAGSDAAGSPALIQFRRNPFRILRLDVTARSEQAVWKAESLVARVRSGVLPEPLLVPWLADADELEIRDAAHQMEEPLRRFVEQLIWFDFSNDRETDALRRVLDGRGGADLAVLLAEGGAVVAPETRPAQVSPVQNLQSIAERMNRANLCLLVGFSALHGVGPAVDPDVTVPMSEGTALPWQEKDEHAFLDDAHTLTLPDGTTTERGRRFVTLLAKGYGAWAMLLEDADFGTYLQTQMESAGDELVSAEDDEAIRSAVRTLLIDLLASEMRAMMTSGRYEPVADLCRVAIGSRFSTELWVRALRPLRHQFELQIVEIEPLIDPSAPTSLENVTLFLKRLGGVRSAWKELDPGNLLGLGEIVDKAVFRTYERLRTMEIPSTETTAFAEALSKAADTANAPSLADRITTYRDRFVRYRSESVCLFCGKRDGEAELAAVVTGQKVTDVTRSGNTTTTHYNLKPAELPRCERCFRFHDLLSRARLWTFLAVLPYPFLVLWAFDFDVTAGIVGFLASILAGFVGFKIVEHILYKQTHGAVLRFTADQSERARELQKEGYTLQRVNYARNAVASWNANARAKGGAGSLSSAGIQVLTWLAMVGFVTLLRNC